MVLPSQAKSFHMVLSSQANPACICQSWQVVGAAAEVADCHILSPFILLLEYLMLRWRTAWSQVLPLHRIQAANDLQHQHNQGH
jgi:hypothetical protein